MSKSKNQQRHAFLLTFFPQTGDFYEEKEVNGFWLVKQYNRGNDSWEGAIYPRESFLFFKG